MSTRGPRWRTRRDPCCPSRRTPFPSEVHGLTPAPAAGGRGRGGRRCEEGPGEGCAARRRRDRSGHVRRRPPRLRRGPGPQRRNEGQWSPRPAPRRGGSGGCPRGALQGDGGCGGGGRPKRVAAHLSEGLPGRSLRRRFSGPTPAGHTPGSESAARLATYCVALGLARSAMSPLPPVPFGARAWSTIRRPTFRPDRRGHGRLPGPSRAGPLDPLVRLSAACRGSLQRLGTGAPEIRRLAALEPAPLPGFAPISPVTPPAPPSARTFRTPLRIGTGRASSVSPSTCLGRHRAPGEGRSPSPPCLDGHPRPSCPGLPGLRLGGALGARRRGGVRVVHRDREGNQPGSSLLPVRPAPTASSTASTGSPSGTSSPCSPASSTPADKAPWGYNFPGAVTEPNRTVPI